MLYQILHISNTPMSAVRPLPLHALAEALVLQPSASMEQLAQAIGVSRATLHRMVASRDDLIYQVHRLAYECCEDIFAEVELDHGPVLEVLNHLITAIHPHANLFLLLHQQGNICRDPNVRHEIHREWRNQHERLTRFFLRGQQGGQFRRDLPAGWIVDAMGALITSATEARHNGHLADADVNRVVLSFLLDGLKVPVSQPH